jgi:hypothetical protein
MTRVNSCDRTVRIKRQKPTCQERKKTRRAPSDRRKCIDSTRSNYAKAEENGENSGEVVSEKQAGLWGVTVIPMRVEAVEGFYRHRIATMKGSSLAVTAMLAIINDFVFRARLSVNYTPADGGANGGSFWLSAGKRLS